MNSLNLRQVDGGNVIKQADFGSNLSFELLDERRRKIPGLDGQTATIRLIKGDNIAYQTESQVVDGSVSFKFDRVLEKGIYVLEIVAGNYVFPSNNMLKITIEKTAGNYKPENMIKTDLVELQGKITAIEQREHDVNQELMTIGQNQVEMTKRIETLEQKQDKDTIYDDSELVSRVTALENKPDKDTIYDDSDIKRRLTALESKEDHDTIYNDTEIKKSIANVDNKVSGLSEKVTALEERPIVDTALTKRVEALERKEDKDTVYDDSAIVKRIESLEAREDKDTIYDDSDLKRRIIELENRPVAEPYNDIEIKDRLTVLESKQDKDTIYDDTDIKERISALEEKPDKDTIYDDTNLKAQVSELQNALNTLVRKRPPMSFYIDRTDMSKKLAVFDNGCILSNFTDALYNYYYGYPGGHDNRAFDYYNLPGNLIKLSIGIVGIDSLKEERIASNLYYCNTAKVLNPINDSSQFNFDDIVLYDYSATNKEQWEKDFRLVCQRNFVKIAYEIGALNESEIIKLGAVKK